MTDEQAVKRASEVFRDLTNADIVKLKELNMKIQNHTGGWGVRKGGGKQANGAIEMPWIENNPLIFEFLNFMHEKNLVPVFDWMKWNEGLELFSLEDQAKYDNTSLEVALKLIYTATRKERFVDGTLAWAFESGGFTKLVKRLVQLQATETEL